MGYVYWILSGCFVAVFATDPRASPSPVWCAASTQPERNGRRRIGDPPSAAVPETVRMYVGEIWPNLI